MIDDQTKLVFISYSREKSDYVRNIVERLLGDGIQVYFDQYDLKHGNHLIPYMEKSVNDPNVDFVLVFCDKSYMEKANARKGGVGIESTILSQEVYNNIEQSKVVPIVIERDGERTFVPTFLKDIYHIDLTKDDFEKEYESLVRLIYDKPEVRKPKLGQRPAWLDDESVDYSEIRTLIRISSLDVTSERKLFDEVVKVLKELIESEITDGPSYKSIIDNERICRDLVIEFYVDRIRKEHPVGINMGEFLEYLDNNLRFRNDPPRQDLADFFKWEFAVLFATILLKFDRIDDFSSLFNKTYFVESWEKTLTPTSFTHFNFYCRSIDEILVRQLNLNKISMQAFLLTSRPYVPYFDSRDLSAADIVLYHLSSISGKDRPWFPRLYIYLDGHIELWERMQSINHSEKLLSLFEVEDIDSLKSKIKEATNPNYHYQINFGWAPWITDYIVPDKIGTCR